MKLQFNEATLRRIQIRETIRARFDNERRLFSQGIEVLSLCFIAETKGSMSSLELRGIESARIQCARKFFARITSDEVKYDVVDSYGKLMELVK